MKRTSFADMPCPIARGLDRVGEWWSLLIIRDALFGMTRFDQFEASLGIAPAMLTKRLNSLVEAGLLEKRLYSARPPRHEYVLTERGRELKPVLQSLAAWGTRHFAPEGAQIETVNRETGELAEPVLVDRVSGRPMSDPVFVSRPGPAAGEATLRRFARP